MCIWMAPNSISSRVRPWLRTVRIATLTFAELLPAGQRV